MRMMPIVSIVGLTTSPQRTARMFVPKSVRFTCAYFAFSNASVS